MKLGIIGNGFVGKASTQLRCDAIDVIAYDKRAEVCEPLHTTVDDLLDADVIMVSVPTPMSATGECHTGFVRQVVDELRDKKYAGFIVLRSTVPVGTSDGLGVFFMPEFLTERNAMLDFVNNPDWIFGIYEGCSEEDAARFRECMTRLFSTAKEHGRVASSTTHYVTAREAEMTKMFRNCFLAVKASFCNEIYRFCQAKNVDYNVVREMTTIDARIGASHTMVPGPDGRFGFGGTCFPKDLNSLYHEMNKAGVEAPILAGAKLRNETIDRPERDWESDKGRAVV